MLFLPIFNPSLGRREKLPQKVGRKEKLAEKVGRRGIYLPVPPPSIHTQCDVRQHMYFRFMVCVSFKLHSSFIHRQSDI